MGETTDIKHYARWLLGHPGSRAAIEAPEGPWTCEDCPWGATTREQYYEIANDPSEAHYNCPVLGKEVWGEGPQCAEHQTSLLVKIVETVGDWETYLKEREAEAEAHALEQERVDGLRSSGLSKLTDDEIAALGLRRS